MSEHNVHALLPDETPTADSRGSAAVPALFGISVPTAEMGLWKMRGIGKKKMKLLREAGLVIPYQREPKTTGIDRARTTVKYYEEGLSKARAKLEKLLARQNAELTHP